MFITKASENEKIILTVEGRIDTLTAPEFQDELMKAIESENEIVIDLANVTYISSAALRSFLMGQKAVSANKKKMCIVHVTEDVMKVFEMTGFTRFLTMSK